MNEEKKEFICKKCGACCRHLNLDPDSEFLDRGDGVCKYFDQSTNLCTIYEFRPDICRTDKMFKRYKNKMTWNQFIDLNYKACEELAEMEKAIEYRKQYPDKKHYDDIFDKDEPITKEEINMIDDSSKDTV